MLFSLLYFLVRRFLGAGSHLQDDKDIELLVLRHQVKVLQRQVKRPRLYRLDRVLLAAASKAMTRSIWSSFVVRPGTGRGLPTGSVQLGARGEIVESLSAPRSLLLAPPHLWNRRLPKVAIARGRDECRCVYTGFVVEGCFGGGPGGDTVGETVVTRGLLRVT